MSGQLAGPLLKIRLMPEMKIGQIYVPGLHTPKPKRVLIHVFWGAFIMYSFFFAITVRPGANFIISQAFQLMALGLLGVSAAGLIRLRVNHPYLRLMLTLLLLWSFIVIVRGFEFSYDFIKRMLFNGWYGMLHYFLPLVVLIPHKLYVFKKLFEVMIIMAILNLGLDFLHIQILMVPDLLDEQARDLLEVFSNTLTLSLGFMFITYRYQPKSRLIFASVMILTTLFFAVFRARRGMLLMNTLPLLIAYAIYAYQSKNKVFIVSSSVIIVAVLLTYGLNEYQQNKHFSNIQEKSMVNTRSGVEYMFFKDMSDLDLLIGRGLGGKYYCPGIDQGGGKYRTVIETGFLNIVLKGGFIELFLWLLIALPACILGLSRSNNFLCKAAGIWIILCILFSYPNTMNTFTLHYLIFWMCIGICYSRPIRTMPEKLLTSYLLGK